MLHLLGLACLTAAVLARDGAGSFRLALLRATVLWASIGVLSAELLGAVSAVTIPALAAVWVVVCLTGLGLARRAPWGDIVRGTVTRVRGRVAASPAFSAVLMGLCGITLVTALVSAPNNYDTLAYHLPRVEHWLQQQSLAHYATNIERQIGLNPGAEILLLHTRAGAGLDAPYNLIQWLAFIVTLMAISRIGAAIGAGSTAKAAVLWFATLPMAILQACSTQNDLVTAAFCLLFLDRWLRLRERPTVVHAVECGAAMGLAVITKGTAMVLLLPFGVWAAVELVRAGPRVAALRGLAMAVPALGINAGWWWRNYAMYGTPLGPYRAAVGNAAVDVGATVSNLVRELASELLTPSVRVNEVVVRGALSIHRWLGLDPERAETSFGGVFNLAIAAPAWPRLTYEDVAASPVHTVVLLLVVCSLGGACLRRRLGVVAGLLLCALTAILLYCTLLRWQPWSTRLHLPFYALLAPLVGLVIGRQGPRLRAAVTTVMVLVSMAPGLANYTRPMWPRLVGQGGPAIYRMDRTQQLFVGVPYLAADYGIALDLIAGRRPAEVGLLFGAGSAEYPVWYMLARQGIRPRISHVLTGMAIEDRTPPGPEMLLAADREVRLDELAATLGCPYEELQRLQFVVVLGRRCRADP